MSASRFGSYLQSQKLAKIHLIQAAQRLDELKVSGAVEELIRAMREFMTCTNCLASMQFERKRRTRRAVKP